MLLERYFNQYNSLGFKIYFGTLLLLLTISLDYSYSLFNKDPLKEDKVITGHLTKVDYYQDLKKYGEGYEELHNCMLLKIDDSIRIALPYQKYREYQHNMDSIVYRSLRVKVYVDSTRYYAFKNQNNDSIHYYYWIPDQLEVAEMFLVADDYRMTIPQMVATMNSDDSLKVLRGILKEGELKALIPASHGISRYHELGYISLHVPVIISILLVIGYLNFRKRRNAPDYLHSKWTDDFDDSDKAAAILLLIITSALLGYASYGLYHHTLFIPGKHGGGLNFHGYPLWMLFSAVILLFLSFVLDLINVYRKSLLYKVIAITFRFLSIVLFFCAVSFELQFMIAGID